MVGLLASLLTAGVLLAPPTPPSRLLVAGPALAGGRVVWGEQQDTLSVLRAWPDSSPLWQSATSWFAGPLAGAAPLVAFSRSYDGCPGKAGVVCPVETQTLAGPPRGSLRPQGVPVHCVAAGPGRRLAVSGALVALLELRCAGSGETVIVREGSRVLFKRNGVTCCDVSLGGSYLAWRSGSAVDVLDLRTHRIAYRAGAPPGEPIVAFDVQADGKLALLLGPSRDGRVTLGWRTPGTATLHRLKLRVALPLAGPALRLIGDHIVTVAAEADGATELVLADLTGRVNVLARFAAPVEQSGAIDATSDRVTWASRQITGSRVDCPPPGQGRPCRVLKSGVETVWLANLTKRTPRPIAHWLFTDAPS
jgi:hypothetical protein